MIAHLPPPPCLGLLDRAELRLRLSDLDLRRVAQYCRNLADLALISDLLPTIAGLYFTARVDTNRAPLDLSQAAVLLGVGLQRKMVETVANELALSTSQAHALLNKAIRRWVRRRRSRAKLVNCIPPHTLQSHFNRFLHRLANFFSKLILEIFKLYYSLFLIFSGNPL